MCQQIKSGKQGSHWLYSTKFRTKSVQIMAAKPTMSIQLSYTQTFQYSQTKTLYHIHLFWKCHCDSICLYYRETSRKNQRKESNHIFETNCASTEMSLRFTHLAPTSSPCTGHKAGLPTNEKQLRYRERNIAMQSFHYSSLPIISHKVEVKHLCNISLGSISPHLKNTLNSAAFIYLYFKFSYLDYMVRCLEPHIV